MDDDGDDDSIVGFMDTLSINSDDENDGNVQMDIAHLGVTMRIGSSDANAHKCLHPGSCVLSRYMEEHRTGLLIFFFRVGHCRCVCLKFKDRASMCVVCPSYSVDTNPFDVFCIGRCRCVFLQIKNRASVCVVLCPLYSVETNPFDVFLP